MTPRGPSFDELFDPVFLERATALALRISAAQKGGRLADQRTNAKGQGSDFADFKPYVSGDDLRQIDWNIYRRLGKAFVRVFEERQDLPVYLLVDASGSMFVEETPRIVPALRTALAVAAAALEQHDAVTLLPFGDELGLRLRAVSGRGGLVRVARALADQAPAGGTGLAKAIARMSAMGLRSGLLVVVSDFFDDDGIEAVLRALAGVRHRLLLVQLTSTRDSDPASVLDLSGDLVIDDGEHEAADVTVTSEMLDRYRALYGSFIASLDGFAAGRGVRLLRIDVDSDVLDQLAASLGGGGAIS